MYGKNEILELYLNKVYFGDGLYGVEAASRGYFGKSSQRSDGRRSGAARRADPVAVELCADGQSRSRDGAPQRRAADDGVDRARSIRRRPSARKQTPVKLINGLEIKETFGLYFKEQVRRELVERFGWQRVYQGGLRVYTTLDPELQQAAEKLVENGLADIEQRRGYKHAPRGKQAPAAEGRLPEYLQGALVAMDPTTGYVARDGRRPRLRREPLQSRRRRRNGSPARRSSRSSTPRRSKRATRRRRSSTT